MHFTLINKSKSKDKDKDKNYPPVLSINGSLMIINKKQKIHLISKDPYILVLHGEQLILPDHNKNYANSQNKTHPRQLSSI